MESESQKMRYCVMEDVIIVPKDNAFHLRFLWTRMVIGVGCKNISGSFLEVIEKQGWQGLWAVNMIYIVPTQAIELRTFEYVKRAMTLAHEKWNQNECPKVKIGDVSLNLSPVTMGGATAVGVVSTLVCHPFEVLENRLTVRPDAYPKHYNSQDLQEWWGCYFTRVVGLLLSMPVSHRH